MTDRTTTPVVVLDRHAVRNAVAAAGMAYTSNTVRPPKSAKQLASTRGLITQGELAGAYLTVTLFGGSASDGYKTDYERRPRWWTLLAISDEPGHVVWAIGTRWSRETKARADYEDSAQAIREGR